jgi:hypothetical protein
MRVSFRRGRASRSGQVPEAVLSPRLRFGVAVELLYVFGVIRLYKCLKKYSLPPEYRKTVSWTLPRCLEPFLASLCED